MATTIMQRLFGRPDEVLVLDTRTRKHAVVLGDPWPIPYSDYQLARARAQAAEKRFANVAESYLGMYRVNMGQPSRSRGCVNCGAPHEAVCSYCGSVA